LEQDLQTREAIDFKGKELGALVEISSGFRIKRGRSQGTGPLTSGKGSSDARSKKRSQRVGTLDLLALEVI